MSAVFVWPALGAGAFPIIATGVGLREEMGRRYSKRGTSGAAGFASEA